MDLLDLLVTIGIKDEASAKVGQIGGSIKKGLSGAAKLAGAAMGAATAAVGAFAASSVEAGMSFDSSMSQVAATMGKTMDQVLDDVQTVQLSSGEFTGNLRDFAQKMGAETAFSATQAADALNYMALAGYDTKTSMEMLPTVLNLAAAGGIELAEASDMVTDAQSALGLNLEQTREMVDQMAAASSKTNTSVAQLGSAFLTIGGTAKNLSGGTTELATALGLLADNGIKGAEGGTALRNVLLNMSQGKFEETFGALGVSAYDAEGNMRSLKDVFADMNEAMADMTVEEKTKTLSEAFNKVDLKSLNALLATDAERWDEVTAAIDGSQGAAERMAQTQLDNLQGDITLLKSAWEGLQIAVSDKVTPALRDFVQIASDSVSKITEAVRDGDLSAAADVFAEMVSNGMDKLNSMMPSLIDAGGALLGALLSGLLQGIPALITGLGDGITQLANSITDNTDSIFEGAGELFMSIVDALQNTLPQVLGALGNMLVAVVGALVSHAPDILYGAWELFIAIVEGLHAALEPIFQAVSDGIQGAVDAVTGFVGDMFNAGVELVQGLIDGIGNLIGSVADKVRSGVEGAVNGVKSFLGIASPSKLMRGIGQFAMEGMALGIADRAGRVVDAMTQAAQDAAGAAQFDMTARYGFAAGIGAQNAAQARSGGQTIIIGDISYLPDSRVAEAIGVLVEECGIAGRA